MNRLHPPERRERRERREGFALPAAIFSLVLLSALVAGAVFVSTEELRSGRADGADQRALAAAEWALDRAILGWDARRNLEQPVGRTDTLLTEYGPPNDRVIVAATHVQPDAVWMTATATRGGDRRGIPARHTIGASLRLDGTGIVPRAALTTAGTVSVDGGIVDGRDAAALGDSTTTCPENTSAAGIAVPDVSRVTCVACATSRDSGVFGAPAIDSSGLTESAFAALGETTIASLVRRASIDLSGGLVTPQPVSVNGVCDRADPLNWGDPGMSSSCVAWLPVIHVRGSVVLGPGSVGQGILVADGSVQVDGGARFVGLVLAGGEITVSGQGAEIAGAAFAGMTDLAARSLVMDGGAIRFSSCAVRRASIGSARLVRTPGRWWVELR